eukprot:1283054-Amphidinium_carterae.1
MQPARGHPLCRTLPGSCTITMRKPCAATLGDISCFNFSMATQYFLPQLDDLGVRCCNNTPSHPCPC